MFEITVFKDEQDAGLEKVIKDNSSLAYCSNLKISTDTSLSYKAKANILEHFLETSKGSKTDFDLHHLNTILVTTGWNKNKDIFMGSAIYKARHTPEHKPINYEHDCAQIIGHMTDSYTVDAEGKTLEDNLSDETLPAKFHILTRAVLYKYWDKEELQKRMDTILQEISKGEWHVSMECLFKGFDYGLVDDKGITKVIARNEQTSFLTKHLLQYGGNGQYQNYSVGRVLKDIVFSGKGLVRNPANPESIILQDGDGFGGAKAQLVEDFTKLVYSNSSVINNTENEKMSVELETLKTELTKATEAKVAVEKLLSDASEAIKNLQASLTEKVKLLEDVTKSRDEAVDELGKLYKEQTKATRKNTIKEKLKFDVDTAEQFVCANVNLTDEQFASQVELLSKAFENTVKKPVETVVAVTPPVEVDKNGEGTVAKINLDTAKASGEATLTTGSVNDSGVDIVTNAIHAYFKVSKKD